MWQFALVSKTVAISKAFVSNVGQQRLDAALASEQRLEGVLSLKAVGPTANTCKSSLTEEAYRTTVPLANESIEETQLVLSPRIASYRDSIVSIG